ncbi:MAG: chemotaxis protein CheB [Acidiferrobacter sp.]
MLEPSFIVGIGGSAGALSVYKALLRALAPDTGMAFVIVAHMLPDSSSELANILSRYTGMPVMVAATAMTIRADHVYVIPPNADLLVENQAFRVVSPRTRRNAQIDLFFISLAEAMGIRAIGVIVSGYDGDGAEGCKHIKAKGGITFAQDISAEAATMPLNAQASGFVDFVLSPDKISAALEKLGHAEPPSAPKQAHRKRGPE